MSVNIKPIYHEIKEERSHNVARILTKLVEGHSEKFPTGGQWL